jgi:imidazoleglycerol phosphate synthase glutamine amidotransferase subunit HisH
MPRQTEQPPQPQQKQVLHPSWNASAASQDGQIPFFIFSSSDMSIPCICERKLIIKKRFHPEKSGTQKLFFPTKN